MRDDGRDDTDNLELHSLAFQLDSPNLEVDTNGTDVALRVRVICEPQEQARLRRHPEQYSQ